MLQYVCETCFAVKGPDEVWIVGHAAEAVGATSARREVTILSTWNRESAVHPLAVHFCSIACKDAYMARLFSPAAEMVETKEVLVEPSTPAEVVIERTIPPANAVVAKVKSRKSRRRVG
jgi:hypothetical protein